MLVWHAVTPLDKCRGRRIVSASHSPPGLVSCSWHFLMHLNHFGVPVRMHFATLGVTFEAFWGHFCTLEVIFGALWVYLLCPKTDWGAKGAPMSKSPKIPSPCWVPFWCHCSIIFVFQGSIQRASEKTSNNIFLDRIKPRALNLAEARARFASFN